MTTQETVNHLEVRKSQLGLNTRFSVSNVCRFSFVQVMADVRAKLYSNWTLFSRFTMLLLLSKRSFFDKR